MKFSVARDTLLKPLQLVAGVVEKHQTLPVLSNVLLVLDGDTLSITGTDLEVELTARVVVDKGAKAGETTVPARKFVDICRSLPADSELQFEQKGQKVTLKSGGSRFSLTTLSAAEFPSVEQGKASGECKVNQEDLKRLVDSTAFSMAQQDVRYFLNGMLWELTPKSFQVVATDGHRLALSSHKEGIAVKDSTRVLVPRKGVLELSRLLTDGMGEVEVIFGANHLRAVVGDFTFVSKLLDDKFPDYGRVMPKGGNNIMYADRDVLRQSFMRAAILSNEKFRGVRLQLSATGELKILANNPEQEEAEETLAVDYSGSDLEIGFNVSYLIDILNVISSERVKITLADGNTSALLEDESGDAESVYVVMPMRL